MNIFVLANSPTKAAQMACNTHVCKMLIESAQILCARMPNAPYKPTHLDHPCTIWAWRSKANYEWLLFYAHRLYDEYQYRYGPNLKFQGPLNAIKYCGENYENLEWEKIGRTPFVKVVPEDCIHTTAVKSYREYYLKHKQHLLKWKKRPRPAWVSNLLSTNKGDEDGA